MAKTKRVADALLSGVKTPAQMKAEMAVDRARGVLPKAEREANKAKFLEQSADPRRFYHGTKNPDITEFKSRKDLTDESNMTGHYADERDAVFLSPEPDFTSSFSVLGYTDEGQAPTTYPVYAQIKNPFDFDNPEHLQRVKDTYKDMYHNPESELYDPYLQSSERSIDLLKFNKAVDNLQGDPNNWGRIENQKFQDVLKDIGYDSFYTRERGTKNLGVYDPNKIKSAIGNQGTYDLSEPDITKAEGGAVKPPAVFEQAQVPFEEVRRQLGMKSGGAVHMAGGGAGRKLANKMLPKVEAPSIMTRSDISELADYIKNREGGYGLRRVERAADEIPRLGELYTQDALRSAFSGDNARALMTLKPSDFEKYTAPLSTNLPQESVDNIANLKAIQSVGGFSDVPFFIVDKHVTGSTYLPFVTGHEGRHRSRAMDEAGVQSGLVQFMPRASLREPFPRRSQEQYIDAIRKEMALSGNKIKPEQYYPSQTNMERFQRPTLDLPDLYAKGGAVKMSEGGEPDQAEIDRMRLEMSNSPVIQATPQTPIQRAIGTLGGYMDRAGQFVSESIEPLAEKHPIKHFLGELLLADSLKSAGTAMQDYTKTSRDITEDQPYVRAPLTGSGQTLKLDPRMLDVMGIAQPVASATTRLVGAGAKKAAPFAKDVAEMASELYMKGEIPGMIPPNMYAVSPEVKPSKVLAPANPQGFYSPTEAAALNLQRKSGSGQAFLNDLLKQENVRPDEIEAMGLDTFLKGKKDVTATEVQDYIANNKIQLGEAVYQDKPSINKFAMQRGMSEDDANNVVTLARQGNPDAKKIVDEYANTNITKFQQYQLPGGENYREVVLTLPIGTTDSGFMTVKETGRASRPWGLFEEGDDLPRYAFSNRAEAEEARTKYIQKAPVKYQSSHWNEPNALAHLRMSDRVTDGKKTLLVDEVQSDWHQAGREQGYKSNSTVAQTAYRDYAGDLEKRYVAAVREEAPSIYLPSDPADLENFVRKTVNQKSLNDMAKALGEQDKYISLYKDYNLEIGQNRKGVPDAPFKDDWYQLALKRAVKEAIDGGYDRVALPTGSRVAERFDLSKQIDRIDYNKNDDGTYSMSAIKDGREVFAKEGLDEKELSGIVGKDVAKKIVGDEGSSAPKADRWEAEDGDVPEFKSLSGLDLSVGGEGMRKYYDEIYPGYLKKFGKKYGANVGMTSVQTEPSTDRIFKDVGKYYAYTGQGRDTKEFNTYAEALKFLGIGSEPLHYMEITPAMREAFKTGIHMKRGGKVQFANNIDAMRLALSKG
jgi:hypothetical protein